MSTDAPPRSTKGARLTLVVLGLCLLAIALMYVRGGRTSLGVVIAGGLPVLVALAVVAALVPWRHRTGWRATLLAIILVSQAPLLDHAVPDGADVDPGAPTIRVTTLNTMHSGPSDASLVDLAEDADVLGLQEWNPDRTAGLTAALGPRWRLATDQRDDYIGAHVTVWVRTSWRIDDAESLPGEQAGTSLRLRRGEAEVTVVGTRLQNPAFLAADRWGAGLDSLRTVADRTDGPLVVMGDLNATPSAVAFRGFARRSGLRDCTAQLGSGYPGTWGRTPTSWAPVPIDHVMTRDAACTDLRITRHLGSDHSALRAVVALPRD